MVILLNEAQNENLDSVLSEAKERLCSSYYEVFANKAREVDDKSKVNLELLRDVTSFCFCFVDNNAPFEPLFHSRNGNRSPSIEDLDDAKIERLIFLVDKTTDSELRSRIFDILQCKYKINGKNLGYARSAVKEYIFSLECSDFSEHDRLERVKRIGQIAKKYQKGDENISLDFFYFFDNYINHYMELEDYYFSLQLLKILYELRLIHDRRKEYYNNFLCGIIEKLKEKQMLRVYKIGLEVAIKNFSDEQQKKAYKIELAGVYESFSEEGSEASILKVQYIREAIKLFREIGEVENKGKINLLELRLVDITKKALANSFSWHLIERDISFFFDLTNKKIEGASLKEMLECLARLEDFGDINAVILIIKSALEDTPFLKSVITEIYDSDLNLQCVSDKDENDLSAQESYLLKIVYYADQALLIEHIRTIMKGKYNPSISEIGDIYNNSVWVPFEHKVQINRGIFSGFNGDWMQCGLFLIPVFEVMLRAYLQSEGFSTVKLNRDNTQEGKTLDELFVDPRLKENLGESLIFELKFLLTNRKGYKLRHSISHGGLTDNDFSSEGIKIMWKIILKLLIDY